MNNFYYIIGEKQSTVIEERKEVADFTQQNMGAINTAELHQVLANVFGKGEYFPGPDEVLTSIIHESVRRWDVTGEQKQPYCVLITALRLLKGDIDVAPLATIALEDQEVSPENVDSFYTFLLHSLPTIQDKLVEKAYAPDSKLVAIIKDAAEFHLQQKQ